MDKSLLAAMVHFHRKKSGLSQAELGKLAGVGKTVIYDIEKSKLSIRFDLSFYTKFSTHQSCFLKLKESSTHKKKKV